MQTELPVESCHLVNTIVDTLGTTFSINDFIAYVSQERKKDVVVVNKLIDTAYLGLCFSFNNCDLIIVVPNLSRRLYLITLLHELIHVLCGDAKHYDKVYDDATHNSILSLDMTRRDADMLYNDLPDDIKVREDIAETSASLLFEYVWRNEESVPAMVQRIYGYKE